MVEVIKVVVEVRVGSPDVKPAVILVGRVVVVEYSSRMAILQAANE